MSAQIPEPATMKAQQTVGVSTSPKKAIDYELGLQILCGLTFVVAGFSCLFLALIGLRDHEDNAVKQWAAISGLALFGAGLCTIFIKEILRRRP